MTSVLIFIIMCRSLTSSYGLVSLYKSDSLFFCNTLNNKNIEMDSNNYLNKPFQFLYFFFGSNLYFVIFLIRFTLSRIFLVAINKTILKTTMHS